MHPAGSSLVRYIRIAFILVLAGTLVSSSPRAAASDTERSGNGPVTASSSSTRATSVPAFFQLPGSFNYGIPHYVIDAGTEREIAVVIGQNPYPDVNCSVQSFDPLTGAVLDIEGVGFSAIEVRVVELGAETRVVAITSEGNAGVTATVMDLAADGALTVRERKRLTTSQTSYASNLVFSASARAGFMLLYSDSLPGVELVAFSLDDGHVFSRTPATNATEALGLHESGGQRRIVYTRWDGLGMALTVLDATNVGAVVALGSVPLPRNVEFSGNPATDFAFSSDSRYVYAANQFIDFACVDTVLLQVVDTLAGQRRFTRVQTHDSSGGKMLAVESSSSGTLEIPHELLIVDASNPASLVIVDVLEILPDLYGTRTDFRFSRGGSQIFLGLSGSVRAYSFPALDLLWSAPTPFSGDNYVHRIVTYGHPERVLGAWDLFHCWVGSTEAFPAATDSAGVYVASAGTWFLKNANEPGGADVAFGYGPSAASWIPLSGDWDGNGTDTAGLYDPSNGFFYLKNTNTPGPADQVFGLGPGGPGLAPLSGDWDGDGRDSVGLYHAAAGFFFLKNSNAPGSADLVFGFGPGGIGWSPLSGDWDGDGRDSVGLYAPASSFFFLRNENAAGPADLSYGFGPSASGWKPITGDFDSSGDDTVGLYDPSTGNFFLRIAHAPGGADVVFGYGPTDVVPILGDWDGQ
jgi:hypothetical protein